MFVKIKIADNLAVGTVLAFDSVNNQWDIATNDESMVGVIGRPPTQNEETLEWTAAVYFAGTVSALADRALPNEGGNLCISNGKVYVDNTENGCGLVAPNARGLTQRQADDLVLIHLK